MDDHETLEAALAAAEERSLAAIKAAGAATRELKKARSAAATGETRSLRRALEAAEALADRLADTTAELRRSFDVDEQQHLASGAYTKELLAEAATAGLSMFEEDERLLCYPSLIRLLPGESAVEIDRARDRRLRPSVLVRSLKARQESPPRFKPEPFLESLLAAYDLVVAQGSKQPDAVVRLVDVWAVLTLLPGQAREYTRQEFSRDLYLLDQSNVTTTSRIERTLRWSASTGTKQAGVLTTVARNGQQQRYWGISFT